MEIKAMAPVKQFIFHRGQLAVPLVDSLAGVSPFDQTSGLFLAAPRRTGKSTFLRLDMLPEFERRGAVPIIVDLWSDVSRDPASLIVEAIKDAIHRSEAGAIKVMRKMGVTKFGTGGISFDLDKVGAVGGITIADALQYLFEKTGRPIALVVDEAQHALNTAAGVNAMFAVKAARDALNQNEEGEIRFMAVFTGSNRDKLTNLVLGRDKPFFGASITNFPLLDREYSDAYTDWLNERLAADNHFDHETVFSVFDAVRRRPEQLRKILNAVAFSEGRAASLADLLADDATALRQEYLEKFESAYNGLEPLQKAVLVRLIQQGAHFSPFSTESLAEYGRMLGGPAPSPASVQKALAALRNLDIVWQPSRGNYALDDADMAEWFRARSCEKPSSLVELGGSYPGQDDKEENDSGDGSGGGMSGGPR